jgi:signal transduction histidine kinase
MNAIEAMPDGGQVTATIEKSGDDAVLTVADTGPGIPAEIQSRIYEPFFSTKTEGKGTGLGLAVVYGIVQRHRGRITLDTAPGKGTAFRITLPIGAPVGAVQEEKT